MALQSTPEQRERMLQEFSDIVRDVEEKIMADPHYAASGAYATQKRRMTQILTTVEGCGCNGRGEMLASMFRSLAKGNTGVLKSFTPTVFKSFASDAKRIFKIL